MWVKPYGGEDVYLVRSSILTAGGGRVYDCAPTLAEQERGLQSVAWWHGDVQEVRENGDPLMRIMGQSLRFSRHQMESMLQFPELLKTAIEQAVELCRANVAEKGGTLMEGGDLLLTVEEFYVPTEEPS